MESTLNWELLGQLYDIRSMFVNEYFLLQFSLETVILLCFSSWFTTIHDPSMQGPDLRPKKL